jgi:hypothetical protein
VRLARERAQDVERVDVPDPSQIEFSGLSRNSRGIPDSST